MAVGSGVEPCVPVCAWLPVDACVPLKVIERDGELGSALDESEADNSTDGASVGVCEDENVPGGLIENACDPVDVPLSVRDCVTIVA